MWDAYLQPGELMKYDKSKERKVERPERPLESGLASLQVRVLLYTLLLMLQVIIDFLRMCSPSPSRCLPPIRPVHYPQAQNYLRQYLPHLHLHLKQHKTSPNVHQERSGQLSTLTG